MRAGPTGAAHRFFSRGRPLSTWLDARLASSRYPLLYYLIGANAGIFLIWGIGGWPRRAIVHWFPLERQRPRLHALLTHAFTHFSPFHLSLNMLTLYCFGKHLEALFGPRVLLSLYLAGAVGGGLLHLFSGGERAQGVVGASGAVSALLAFFVANFPRERMLVFPLPLPLPAWAVGAGLLAYSALSLPRRDSRVSHASHLGGLLAGLGYYCLLRRAF